MVHRQHTSAAIDLGENDLWKIAKKSSWDLKMTANQPSIFGPLLWLHKAKKGNKYEREP